MQAGKLKPRVLIFTSHLESENARLRNENKQLKTSQTVYRETAKRVRVEQRQLQQELDSAKDSCALAESLLEPHKKRLEDMTHLGRRVHGALIERVIRLCELQKRLEAKGGLDDLATAPIRKEMQDNLFVLANGWRRVHEEYSKVTCNGTFAKAPQNGTKV